MSDILLEIKDLSVSFGKAPPAVKGVL